ncbi:hypothetical protein ACLBKT_01440 [Erythrobacter sp. W302b]|uniref:hypothetical protein n=1 Tax=Erythrobacter sp. W302b TaxID=3389874 RepID=UPI00396B013F
MAVFIVTYDLNKEVKRPNILKLIQDWNWAKLSESSYAVEATSSTAVYDRLKPVIDDNDNLFVIPLRAPYRGWGPKDVHDWLAKKLA